MGNHRLQALTLSTPSIKVQYTFAFVKGPVHVLRIMHIKREPNTRSYQLEPSSRTMGLALLSKNQHLVSVRAPNKSPTTIVILRTQARSTSAAANKQASSPPSVPTTSPKNEADRQSSERTSSTCGSKKLPTQSFFLAYSFRTIDKRESHVYIHSLISTCCIVPPAPL